MVVLELAGRDLICEVAAGATLLGAIRRSQTPLGQSCLGRGVCRSCDVVVQHGASHLTAPTSAEARWALPDGSRLACQARIAPDAPAGARIVVWHPAWGPVPTRKEADRDDSGHRPGC